MNGFLIVPIVEGKGEEEAVPRLLHRLFQQVRSDSFLKVNPPLRIKLQRFLKGDDYFQKYIELAAAKAKGHLRGGVLILLDCDDGCPVEIGRSLAQKAREVRPDVPFVIALARREYETWFLAAACSLRGVAGIPANLEPPPEPEAIRGAKEWLSRQMEGGYDPLIHQLLFTERFSLEEARRSRSFARFNDRLRQFFEVRSTP